jgi:hypothetical protein
MAPAKIAAPMTKGSDGKARVRASVPKMVQNTGVTM